MFGQVSEFLGQVLSSSSFLQNMSKKTGKCRDLYEMLLVETVSEIHACTNIKHTHTHSYTHTIFNRVCFFKDRVQRLPESANSNRHTGDRRKRRQRNRQTCMRVKIFRVHLNFVYLFKQTHSSSSSNPVHKSARTDTHKYIS